MSGAATAARGGSRSGVVHKLKAAALQSRRRVSELGASARLRRSRRRRWVLVLGDSHARVFRQPIFASLPFRFEVESIMGATVSGLENPNSLTQAGPIFERRLREAAGRARGPEAIVLVLGEVDCGFVFWWLHQERGLDIDASVTRAVDNLVALTKRASTVAPVIVVSAQLPTIRDNARFPEYAGARRTITASQTERTALVRRFNQRAREAVDGAGAAYLDLDETSLGPDGLVSPILVKPHGTDHHYDGVVYARLIQRQLTSLKPFRS